MSVERWHARPLAEVVRELAVAVAEGQAELDRSVDELARDRAADAPPPTPYRFAEVDLDVRLSLSLHAKPEARDGEVRGYRPFLAATPLSPDAREREAVDADLTSAVRARLVPVPADRPQRPER
jgi:hypothetical protein